MSELTQEYATDPLTGETVAVDPPLQGSDTPLMGNPVLTRRTAPRRAQSNTSLYAAGAAIAVLVLGGGAYLVASGMHQQSNLTTAAPTAPVTQEAAVTPAATPAPAPIASTPTAPAPVLASAEEQPVAPARAPRAAPSPKVAHHQAARAAEDESADTSASAPQTATVVPQQSQVAGPPVTATPSPPAAAPSEPAPAPAAPVITPPSN